MTTISIVQVSNGFILTMHDEDSNLIDSAIATSNDIRGYSGASLATAIEDMFVRNRAPVVVKPVVDTEDEIATSNGGPF